MALKPVFNPFTGKIDWVTSGGTPGGLDTQVQFNDGGTAFGGNSGFTYNKTTEQLRLRSADFFDQLLRGVIRLPEPDYFDFKQAAQAQDALASRQTLGAVGLKLA